MDLYCQLCGEPYEHYYVVNDMCEEERERFLDGLGCDACDWGLDAPDQPPLIAEQMAWTMQLMGDDLDGVASCLDGLDEKDI